MTNRLSMNFSSRRRHKSLDAAREHTEAKNMIARLQKEMREAALFFGAGVYAILWERPARAHCSLSTRSLRSGLRHTAPKLPLCVELMRR
mmetsp:Transcript_13386/g.35984  ORF Transcript_13386/g.35984 Transcript_13386/m.35984 type:complete len:90 (+) Transcript_13386:1-270(+)